MYTNWVIFKVQAMKELKDITSQLQHVWWHLLFCISSKFGVDDLVQSTTHSKF